VRVWSGEFLAGTLALQGGEEVRIKYTFDNIVI